MSRGETGTFIYLGILLAATVRISRRISWLESDLQLTPHLCRLAHSCAKHVCLSVRAVWSSNLNCRVAPALPPHRPCAGEPRKDEALAAPCSSFPRPWWLRKLVGSSAFSNSLGRAIDRALLMSARIQGGLMRPLAPKERVLDADHFAALKLREDNAEWLSSPTTGCLDDGRKVAFRSSPRACSRFSPPPSFHEP